MSRVAIVGAGIAGCAAARELAPDHEVVVLEAEQVASGATGRAAGLVAPSVFYGDEPALAEFLLSAFRDLDGIGSFRFTERSRLELATRAEASAARETATRLQEAGLDVQYRRADVVERDQPRFDLTAFAGAVQHHAGWVDPHTLARTLLDVAERDGATVRRGVAATGVETSDGEVTGVATSDGHVAADDIVVAAGRQTRALLADIVEIPLRPYRTQCVVLRPAEPLDATFPLGRATSEAVYFRPEHSGDLLVGGASEPVESPETAPTSVDEHFREHVADTVPTFLPSFSNAEFVEGWAGIDCATPDGRGIVDAPTDAPDGLVIATGFTGLGIMTAPATGAAVRAHVTGEELPFPTDVFALDRFTERSADFEFESTFDH